ncbi:ribulose-phosphate 3-epimerase [bacterium]|nr:ribulose-phosphate 3-epimerase [bacterium]
MSRKAALSAIRSSRPAIAPSMLKCDFGNLHREIELLESAGAPLLHLDIMDGNFVPNLSYGAMVIKRMRELTKLPFDAHLMISDPAKYMDEYIDAGCELITFHLEAQPDPVELLKRIRSADCASGLAINPGTPVEDLKPFLEHCDLILIMSVEPGFGGQKFMPVALEKLQAVRQLVSDDTLLSVDGGIGTSTIAGTAQAGADIFVAGSAIFDTPDYKAAIDGLHQLASAANASAGQGGTDV